ncbi:MAG: PilZ domain-containing protein [Terriglobia bacterium]
MKRDYDRRADPRIEPREPLSVEYPALRARVRDISLSGAYIEDPRPLPRGRVHQVCIWLDTHTSVTIKAMVRHCEEGKGMGIEFLEMSREDENRLRRFVTPSEAAREKRTSAEGA